MTHLLNIEFPVLPQIHHTVTGRKELYLVLGTCEDAVGETCWRSLVKTFIVKKRRCIQFHTILHYLVIFFYSCSATGFTASRDSTHIQRNYSGHKVSLEKSDILLAKNPLTPGSLNRT